MSQSPQQPDGAHPEIDRARPDIDRERSETDRARPDIDRAAIDDWPQRPFPIQEAQRQPARVVIRQTVLNDVHAHGQSHPEGEVCGVLVGGGYRDRLGPFVYVEASIRGQHSDSQAAQVTFTGETWNHIHNELDRNYPDQRILGWYHTHPGFGIFLSGMDLFIHENYFNADEQLALVYDPIGGDEGLFVWRGGKAVRDGFLVEPDAPVDPPPVRSAPPSEPELTAGAVEAKEGHDADRPARDTGAGRTSLAQRVERLERRHNLLMIGLALVALLAAAGPVTALLLSGPLQMLQGIDSRQTGGPSRASGTNDPRQASPSDNGEGASRHSEEPVQPSDESTPNSRESVRDDQPAADQEQRTTDNGQATRDNGQPLNAGD